MKICWILGKTAARGAMIPLKLFQPAGTGAGTAGLPHTSISSTVQEPGASPAPRGAAGGTEGRSRTAGTGPGPAARAPQLPGAPQTLPVLAASLRPKLPSSSEPWGHGARPGQPGVTRPGDTAEPSTRTLLCWARCWAHLGALGRGPLEAAGIHGLVAVGPLGLLGDPLVDQVLGTAGGGSSGGILGGTAPQRGGGPASNASKEQQNNSGVTPKQEQNKQCPAGLILFYLEMRRSRLEKPRNS